MKTAMQELIEKMQEEHERVRLKLDTEPCGNVLIHAIAIHIFQATELLEKEKEQIMDAYVDAQAHENRGIDSLKYYQQTYKKEVV